jgi:PIN domain nuclease of toxin-antitoxin system
VRLLLDTHVALWAIADDPKLPDKARALIVDPANLVHVSAASIWEIAIKHALSRGVPGDMPVSGARALRYFEDSGYSLLPISPAHAASVEDLPALHADPFDRLLIAQSLAEPLRLVTHDQAIARYGGSIIYV